MSKIEIEVEGEYADDLVDAFRVWFWDAGGFQEFSDLDVFLFENTPPYDIQTRYDNKSKSFIIVTKKR